MLEKQTFILFYTFFDVSASRESKNKFVNHVVQELSSVDKVKRANIYLEKANNGKPFIQSKHKQFPVSISHSGELHLFLFSQLTEVGIDVEYIKKKRNIPKLSQRYFSSEENKTIEDAENDSKVFYRFWCIKEALYKIYNQELPHRIRFDFNVKDLQNSQIESTKIQFKNKPHLVKFLTIDAANSDDYVITFIQPLTSNSVESKINIELIPVI